MAGISVDTMQIYTISATELERPIRDLHFLHPENPSDIQFEIDATHACSDGRETERIIEEMQISGYIHVRNICYDDDQGELYEG